MLHIDNRRYASNNMIFGRIVAPLVGLGAAASIVSILRFADLSKNGVIIGLGIQGIIVVLMAIVVWRRGRHPLVMQLELGEQLVVEKKSGEQTHHSWDRVERMEYEGLRNPARVRIPGSPFPKHDQRVLVITLDDGRELRVRVEHQHDVELKKIASDLEQQQRAQHA